MAALSRFLPLERGFVTLRRLARFRQSVSYNTRRALGRAPLPSMRVWAVPRSLAATKGMVSFPRGT